MRKYVVGILIGFCLSFGFGAHAEVSTYVGRLIEGAFPVTYNDAAIGEGLVIDGTTYLPVRKLGEAMGLTVLFDADLGVSLKKGVSVTGDTYGLEPTSKEVQSQLTKQTVERKLGKITTSIESIKSSILETKSSMEKIQSDHPYQQTLKARLDEYEAELADLEKLKAELTK